MTNSRWAALFIRFPYPIGYFRIEIPEVQTAEGKLRLLVAIDRTSKFAYAELHQEAAKMVAAQFLRKSDRGGPLHHPHGADGLRHLVHQPTPVTNMRSTTSSIA